ncbi:MAG: hypothetical protein AAF066_13895 [Pseudomonadota bacterium]
MSKKRSLSVFRRRNRYKDTMPRASALGVKSALAKAIATALVAGAAGYMSALLISPDQLYRKVFLPDANDFSGAWQGRVGGQIAIMRLEPETVNGEQMEGRYVGELDYAGRTIEVKASTDSRVIVSGNWSQDETLELSLIRVVPAIRSVNERFVQLESFKDEHPAHICKRPDDNSSPSSFDEACRKLSGLTHFFR